MVLLYYCGCPRCFGFGTRRIAREDLRRSLRLQWTSDSEEALIDSHNCQCWMDHSLLSRQKHRWNGYVCVGYTVGHLSSFQAFPLHRYCWIPQCYGGLGSAVLRPFCFCV